VIGDLFVLWEMLRSEARNRGGDEEYAVKEFFMWCWATSALAVGGLMLWKLWSVADSLRVIAEKLSCGCGSTFAAS
jgi:hypothetical protein